MSLKEVSEETVKELEDLAFKIRNLEDGLKEAREQLDKKLEALMEACETCEFDYYNYGSYDNCRKIAKCQRADIYLSYLDYTIPHKI
jgi:hypothetical protein